MFSYFLLVTWVISSEVHTKYIAKYFSNITVNEGDSLSLISRYVFYKYVVWKFNGEEIKSGGRYENANNLRLRIWNITYKEAGIYQHIAYYSYGHRTASGYGYVYVNTFHPQIREKEVIYYLDALEKKTFQCSLIVYPRPKWINISWYKEESRIINGIHFEYLQENLNLQFYIKTTSTLIIKNVTSTQSGRYRCKMETDKNSSGLLDAGSLTVNDSLPPLPHDMNVTLPLNYYDRIEVSWKYSAEIIFNYTTLLKLMQPANKIVEVYASREYNGSLHKHTFLGLKNNTNYRISIQSQGVAGYGEIKTIAIFIPRMAPPGPPENLTAVSIKTNNRVDIKFSFRPPMDRGGIDFLWGWVELCLYDENIATRCEKTKTTIDYEYEMFYNVKPETLYQMSVYYYNKVNQNGPRNYITIKSNQLVSNHDAEPQVNLLSPSVVIGIVLSGLVIIALATLVVYKKTEICVQRPTTDTQLAPSQDEAPEPSS